MTHSKPFIASPTPIRFRGTAIPGAEDRQRKVAGFDQVRLSASHILCIGAGGIISAVAPALCRKGVGVLTLLDDDLVEASNLNRQRFYPKDIGTNKALALAENLQAECIAATEIQGLPFRFEEAMERGTDLACDVAVCGVDNNRARVAASRHFQRHGVPVIFAGVSISADHGYVFVQEREGACIGCLLPDIVNDDRFPCPGTPAVGDVLQAVGALATYAVDSLIMQRPRSWNYRRISLSGLNVDGVASVGSRTSCALCTSERLK